MEKLAILGGERISSGDWLGSKWPLATGKEITLIQEVLDSYNWKGGSSGAKVRQFSRLWAEYCEAKHCVLLTNGTMALTLCLQAMGIGAGDEVIVPAWSCAAVVDAVHMAKAVPVFVDIDPNTLCIDPSAVFNALSPRTRAVEAIHFGGLLADMDELRKICEDYGLFLIEDAASAHGVTWQGHKVGSLGDCGVFSFGQGKNLTCGQGGALVTNSLRIADAVAALSELGQVEGAIGDAERHLFLGSNQRMSEFHAAVLISQLGKLDEWNQIRERNARILIERMREIPGITPIIPDQRVTQATWNLLLFRIDRDAFCDISKELFCKAVTAEGVFIAPMHTLPLYDEPMYDLEHQCVRNQDLAIRTTTCPETERACKEVCAVHHSMLMTGEEDLSKITAALAKVQRNSELITHMS